MRALTSQTIIPDHTDVTINSILSDLGIKVKWGEGTVRTMEEFLELINRHQVNAEWNRQYPLLTINVAIICVYYDTGDEILELKETRQTNRHTGISRIRNNRGIGETMKTDETPLEAAMRGLAEELGFINPEKYHLTPTPILSALGAETESGKWPPLRCVYHRHVFGCFLTKELFRSRGYIETRGDWTTYFQWGDTETLRSHDYTLRWIDPKMNISSPELAEVHHLSIVGR
jgi:hypothetical protein